MHDVAAEMTRRDWQVIVLSSARGYDDPSVRYPARELIDGVRIRRFALSSLGKSSILARVIGGTVFLIQATIHALFLRRASCILVSTSPPLAPLAGIVLQLAKRVPLKFWAMDINPDQLVVLGKASERSLSARLLDGVNRMLLRRASDVVALDRFMLARLDHKARIAHKAAVIAPWPHIDRIDEALPHERNPFRGMHGLSGKFVIMYSGNISPSHPLTTLLEAALLLRDREDLVFLFIGGGLGRAEIERFVARHELPSIRLLPYQPLSELRYSLSAADVHLVVMGDEMVGIVHPCKIYGAMAVGRPVLFLGPRPCHISDILEQHDIGWQVTHGDVPGTERTVRRIVASDPRILGEMGRRAQQVIGEHFSREALCSKFCDVLERGSS